MDKFKTGIVGCGKVAHLHAKALKNIDESLFVAVASRSESNRYVFASTYDVKVYMDVSEMVTSEKLDMVIICTPHPYHKEPAIDAMKSGAHVLIEKPMAACLADCDEMISMSKTTGKLLGVVSQRRFYEPCVRIKKAIDEQKIGKPVLGVVYMLSWRDEAYYLSDPWRGKWKEEGGGVLVNQAPHQLDLLQWFMGDIEELYGVWRNFNHPYIEVDDTAAAIIKFKQGGIGNIIMSNSQNPGIYTKVHIHGDKGYSVGVQTDTGSMFVAGMTGILEAPYNDIWTIPGEERYPERWREKENAFFREINSMEYYIQLQVDDFISAIINKRKPMISAEEGRKTVELFTAIYRSQRDNSPVKWPLNPESGRRDFDGRIGG
ncbi:MAG: oxidoreductase [Bacteroides sp. SM23_62_1]|nr:MAG: oxidoreductase [Bacteroides sp. SM23_62_1]